MISFCRPLGYSWWQSIWELLEHPSQFPFFHLTGSTWQIWLVMISFCRPLGNPRWQSIWELLEHPSQFPLFHLTESTWQIWLVMISFCRPLVYPRWQSIWELLEHTSWFIIFISQDLRGRSGKEIFLFQGQEPSASGSSWCRRLPTCLLSTCCWTTSPDPCKGWPSAVHTAFTTTDHWSSSFILIPSPHLSYIMIKFKNLNSR